MKIVYENKNSQKNGAKHILKNTYKGKGLKKEVYQK